MLSEIDFVKTFQALTGHPPFPWQTRLYAHFLRSEFPAQCNLPTGLGKTSVIPIWLIALATKPEAVPRRLVYVVNRRTVVDQATDEAVKIRDQLSDSKLDSLKEALSSLAVLRNDGKNNDIPFAISSLRGQFADNAEWRDDPARPAVIVGTVDMIGSRLLFSGYGPGFKTKPTHAGLLGQDTLIVHDEAHLEPAFQRLLERIAKQQEGDEALLGKQTRVIALTATQRDDPESPPTESPFELDEKDHENEYVTKRIDAAKGVSFHAQESEKQIVKTVVETALDYRDSGEKILIFLRSVEDVKNVSDQINLELKKGAKGKCPTQAAPLTGTLRGLERDILTGARPARDDDPLRDLARIFARFLPPRNIGSNDEAPPLEPMPGTVYLVCTSAGEVGVNISADHLICDLTTFESMAQRFGRVNRFGERNANIDIFHEEKIDAKDEYQTARLQTLEVLRNLKKREDGRLDASPRALSDLPKTEREAAFAPIPEILPVSDILFDAWTLTTIREELPGRPPVVDWLHGVAGWEPPRTSVAWREEVELITDDVLMRQMPPLKREELLEAYPLKPHEVLSDTTFRIFKCLEKLAKVHGDKYVWILGERQKVEIYPLEKLIEKGQELLQHATVILPPKMGGLNNGLLSDSTAYNPETRYDVADEWVDDHKPPRQRRQRRRDDETPPGMREVCKIDLTMLDEERVDQDEDSTKDDIWHWFVRPKFAEDDDSVSRQAPKPQVLRSHLNIAKNYAEKIVKALQVPEPEAMAVVIAAELHDLGKNRKLWQHGIWNKDYNPENLDTVLAKSGNTHRSANQHYRHEFGTIVELANEEISRKIHPVFWEQTEEVQELVRHLIAAHHGRGRPHFPREEAFDPEAFSRANLTEEGVADLACEVPQRFARLQRKYGRWGLAWLETLVRAADVMASRNLEEEP